MKKQAGAHELLRECGFKVEDFRGYLRGDPALIEYAQRLPRELRAEYFSGLVEFFRIYEQLDAYGRARMLRQFRKQFRRQSGRKHSNQ